MQQAPRQAATPQILRGPPALLERLPAVARRHSSVDSLHVALQQIAPKVHLLSPTISPEYVPEFHEVAIRLVIVDPRVDLGEVYVPQGAKQGEVALTKVALDRIAAAAGISWDPLRSGRLDDGSEPHYAHYRRVGYIRDLDGSRRTLVGEKEIDLRDGSSTIKGWTPQRLQMAREHLVALCESKAGNRVIRSLGVKQKYLTAELAAKPFAVLSLILTGRSEDRELERLAKNRMLDAAIATSRELYGVDHPPVRHPTFEPPPPAIVHHPPPPPGAGGDPDDDNDDPNILSPEEILCACPEGPSGIHEEGCKFVGVSDARG